MNEKVIIEPLDDKGKVAVTLYDSELGMYDEVEVMPRQDAFKFYDVVGELVNGEIQIFGVSEEEDDYIEYEDEEYD